MPATPSVSSDPELIARIRAGDKRAEELLYTRYVGYVHALCRRLLANPDEAEDATQDTFLAAFEELSSLRQADRLKPWLARIAVNKAHRRFRKRRLLRALGLLRGPSADFDLLPAAPGVGAEGVLELRRLSHVLLALSDQDRAAWLLRYVEGYKVEEVALMCGCSLATAKRRIGRADTLVRRHVQLEEDSSHA